ncbi:MAG: envelope stress response membrane protein PspB [Gammaproteobacteria bacterium]|nr:envelope stress response membrane protein PspB [Gammaproteobacteria bacterium]
MQTFGFLSVPLIIFLAVVAPLWIFFHYVTKWKRMKVAGAEEGQAVVDSKELRRMRDLAERLEQRIESLETILDADTPDWRKQ